MDWDDRDLYLLFTPALCAQEPWTTLQECLAAGVGLVQWRTPVVDPAELARCAEECHRQSVPLVVNNDVRVAASNPTACGAHVGQDDMQPDLARATLRADQILGISSHDPAQAHRAMRAGADYIGIGPCYPTATKGYSKGIPGSSISQVFAETSVPTFAIGGVTVERLAELKDLGCRRVAVSQAILAAPHPGREVERFLSGLRS